MCKNMYVMKWMDGLLSTSWTSTSILLADALAFSLCLCLLCACGCYCDFVFTVRISWENEPFRFAKRAKSEMLNACELIWFDLWHKRQFDNNQQIEFMDPRLSTKHYSNEMLLLCASKVQLMGLFFAMGPSWLHIAAPAVLVCTHSWFFSITIRVNDVSK